MKRIIGIVIGIGLLLLLGCARGAPAGATLATSVDDVVGVWHSTWRFGMINFIEVYIQFKRDGTFSLAFGDRVEDQPDGEGEFSFEGTRFYWKDIVASTKSDHWWVKGKAGRTWSECLVSNPIGIYEIQLLANGNLKLAEIEDECGVRCILLNNTEWEPVR